MISVCMATFNGATYIQEQMTSILAQLAPYDELIISDDGSTDGTLDLIRGFGDPRIKLLHSQAKNLVANFENALGAAKGDFIFLSDQDDVWQPHKVKMSLEALQEARLVVSDCALVDADGKIMSSSFFDQRPPKKGFWGNLYKNSYMGCCMAFHRDVLKFALPFPPNIPMHDSWIGLIAETLGPVKFVHQKLVLYRRHPQAASTTGFKSSAPASKKILDRAHLARAVVLRRLGVS